MENTVRPRMRTDFNAKLVITHCVLKKDCEKMRTLLEENKVRYRMKEEKICYSFEFNVCIRKAAIIRKLVKEAGLL